MLTFTDFFKKSFWILGDDDDENDPDNSSNQGDNAFAWPTHNSYDEQRYSVILHVFFNRFVF